MGCTNKHFVVSNRAPEPVCVDNESRLSAFVSLHVFVRLCVCALHFRQILWRCSEFLVVGLQAHQWIPQFVLGLGWRRRRHAKTIGAVGYALCRTRQRDVGRLGGNDAERKTRLFARESQLEVHGTRCVVCLERGGSLSSCTRAMEMGGRAGGRASPTSATMPYLCFQCTLCRLSGRRSRKTKVCGSRTACRT